jgi:norsolorinic acid ketoreductase
VLLKLDSCSEPDAAAAISRLQADHGITHLDVVIANAGIASDAEPPLSAPAAAMRSHFEVNTVAPLLLFQACWALLQGARSGVPKFVVVRSDAESIGGIEHNFPLTAYGASKAAVNFVARQIHWRYQDLIAFPVHPG